MKITFFVWEMRFRIVGHVTILLKLVPLSKKTTKNNFFLGGGDDIDIIIFYVKTIDNTIEIIDGFAKTIDSFQLSLNTS